MEYLRIMYQSTLAAYVKMVTPLFYIWGVLLGFLCYLTGLSPSTLSSVFIVILVDMLTRIWAEMANNRKILSKKMFSGFFGKILAYCMLFIVTAHAPYIGLYLQYVVLSGFSLIELRSVYENLLDAKQKHLGLLGDKIGQEIENFKGKPNEEFKQ